MQVAVRSGPSREARDQIKTNLRTGASHGNAGVWKAWKAMKPAFHPSHTPWKSLQGFPHYHGYDDDSHVSKTGKACRKTANQSDSLCKGLVTDVLGPKCNGCSGTLTPLSSLCGYICDDDGRQSRADARREYRWTFRYLFAYNSAWGFSILTPGKFSLCGARGVSGTSLPGSACSRRSILRCGASFAERHACTCRPK